MLKKYSTVSGLSPSCYAPSDSTTGIGGYAFYKEVCQASLLSLPSGTVRWHTVLQLAHCLKESCQSAALCLFHALQRVFAACAGARAALICDCWTSQLEAHHNP